MLRNRISKICQQRLIKQSFVNKKDNIDGFNQELLAKLQSSFKQLLDDDPHRNTHYSSDFSNDGYLKDIMAKNRLTDTVTHLYEDPELKSLNIDEIIKNNKDSKNAKSEKFNDIISHIDNANTFNNSKEKNSLIAVLKKQFNIDKIDEIAQDPKRKLKHLPFNNGIFDLKANEHEIVKNNDVMSNLETFNLDELTFSDSLLNVLKFKGVLRGYLVNKFIHYKKNELVKYFNKNIKNLKKTNKNLSLVTRKRTKDQIVDDYVDIILDGVKNPVSKCNYISLFIRKDLYSLMLSDREISKYVSAYNSIDNSNASVAFIKNVPNLNDWIELICIYDSQMIDSSMINKIQNFKNTLIYQYMDNELLLDELKSTLQSNIYLLHLLKSSSQTFSISELFKEFKDYLRYGKDYGVMILNDSNNSEVLIYTDTALQSGTWVKKFINYKLDELMSSQQGAIDNGTEVQYQNLFDVQDKESVEKKYYLVNEKFSALEPEKDLSKFNKDHVYYSHEYSGSEVTLHSLLSPQIENLNMEKQASMDPLCSNTDSNIKLEIDVESDNFISQKSIVPGVILKNEYSNKSIFTSRYKQIPSLMKALHHQTQLFGNEVKNNDSLNYINMETETCIISHYPYARDNKLVTLDYGKVLNIGDVFLPPLDLLINLKKVHCSRRTKKMLYQLDSNQITPMLLINQKVNFFKTVPLNYDVKYNQEFVYLLDMENVEIDNRYECLILNNAINECKLAEKSDMEEMIKYVRDEEFVHQYQENLELQKNKTSEVANEVSSDEGVNVIKVKLPVKIKIDNKWVTDHILVQYKMNSYKIHSSSPVQNIHDIKFDRNSLIYSKGFTSKNEKYLSYQFENSESLLGIEAFFK